MLTLAQVYSWDTKHPGDRMKEARSDSFLLNTSNMVDIVAKTYDGNSGSQLLFSNNPQDRRDSPDTLVISLTPDELETAHNLTYASNYATLDVFPNTDVTNLGTAEETLIEWDNISYAYATNNDYSNGHCHVVYYDEAWKRKVVIVDHTLAEVAAMTV